MGVGSRLSFLLKGAWLCLSSGLKSQLPTPFLFLLSSVLQRLFCKTQASNAFMAGKYSPTTVAILKLHGSGMRMSAIASAVGCSRGNVSMVLQREAAKQAQYRHAEELRYHIRADGHLDKQWPVSDLIAALRMGGLANSVLSCFFSRFGTKTCSLRDLLDILLPPPAISAPRPGNLPITQIRKGGWRIHAIMVAALEPLDFGPEFRAEFLRRSAALSTPIAKRSVRGNCAVAGNGVCRNWSHPGEWSV